VDRVLNALMQPEWVVYSKPCLARTDTVIAYLGRYSHRVALSDSRLLSFDGESIEPAYQDYRDGGQHKTMTLTGEELVRRFLLHVLPKGFVRVRHFSFLANRCRAGRLSEIRAALEAPLPQAAEAKEDTNPFGGCPCSKFHKGRMQLTAHLASQRRDPGGSTRSSP